MPPPNGTCLTAIDIGTTLPVTVPFDSTGAPADPSEPDSDCGTGHGYASLWYKYTNTGNFRQVVVDLTSDGGTGDGVVTVYSGTCGALVWTTFQACPSVGNPAKVGGLPCFNRFLNPGETIFINVTSAVPTGFAGSFTVSRGTPTGDVCVTISCASFGISCPNGSATVDVPYDSTIMVTGGTPPYTFAITAGALPPGLMLNTSTGEISGTPVSDGTFNFTIQVTDSLGAIVSTECGIAVAAAPPPPVLANRTLVFDMKAKRWMADSYGAAVTARDWEPGQDIHDQILGHANGLVSQAGADGDFGQPIPWEIQVADFDGGDPRREKIFGDLFVSADPQGSTGGLTVTPGYNNYGTVLPSTTIGAGQTGRRSYIIDVLSGLGLKAKNLAIKIAGSDTVRPRLYLWEPSLVPKVESTVLRATDWTDCGRAGVKFMQGLLIHADTAGVTRQVKVEYDNGLFSETFSVSTALETRVPYSFQTPFLAQMVRIVPVDSNPWLFYDVEWRFEPAPELVSVWETQPTTLDFPGYSHEERVLLAYISTQTATLTITVENQVFTYTVPSSSGQYRKLDILESPNKGKWRTYRIDTVTPGVRIFQKDLEVRAKAWGQQGPYQPLRPFGDTSREYGARI